MISDGIKKIKLNILSRIPEQCGRNGILSETCLMVVEIDIIQNLQIFKPFYTRVGLPFPIRPFLKWKKQEIVPSHNKLLQCFNAQTKFIIFVA